MKNIILILFLSFIPNISSATYNNALLMLNECIMEAKTETEQFKNIHCLGYVSGLIDGYSLTSSYRTKPLFCPPKEGIQVESALIILSNHLSDSVSKQKSISTGRTELLLSLVNRFPCN